MPAVATSYEVRKQRAVRAHEAPRRDALQQQDDLGCRASNADFIEHETAWSSTANGQTHQSAVTTWAACSSNRKPGMAAVTQFCPSAKLHRGPDPGATNRVRPMHRSAEEGKTLGQWMEEQGEQSHPERTATRRVSQDPTLLELSCRAAIAIQ